MRLRAEATDPASVEASVLAVPVYKEDDPFAQDLANLDAAAGGVIRQAIEWGRFNILEDYFALIDGGDLPVEHILIVNGVRRGRGPWRARRMAGVATRALQGKGAARLALWLRDGEDADGFAAAAVGAMAGTYRPMDLYGRVRDTEAMKRNVEEVVFLGADQAVLDRAAIMADGVAWCRDLSNRSANDLYPEKMAEEARALEAEGCTVEVLHVPGDAAARDERPARRRPGRRASALPDRGQAPRLGEGRGPPAGDRGQGGVLRFRRPEPEAG